MEFNSYYVNIVQKNRGIKPNILGTSKQFANDYWILKEVVSLYNNYPSIKSFNLNNIEKIL